MDNSLIETKLFRFNIKSTCLIAFLVSMVSVALPTRANESFFLDIDENGETKALSDGLLVIRHMFGFSGNALTAGAIAEDAQRSDPAEIKSHLDANSNYLDIDGDGSVDALSDGLLILRRLFEFSGNALTSGAVTTNSTRANSDQITSFLNTIIDTDNNGIADAVDIDTDNDGVIDSEDPAPFNDSISDWEIYATLDLDGDGVINQHDADDDGDGTIDPLDVYASESSMAERISVKPWFNEIYVESNPGRTILRAEIAKYAEDSCEDIFVTPFNVEGDYIGWIDGGRTDGTQRGKSLQSYIGYYSHFDCTGLEHVNGYGFVDVLVIDGEGLSLDEVAGYALEANGECAEVVSFLERIVPNYGVCAGVNNHVLATSPQELLDAVTDEQEYSQYSMARAGVGNYGADFADWYQDDRHWTSSSGPTRWRNNFQIITWAPPESLPRPDTTELAVLEIPKPRNTIVKALLDSGWSKPMKNENVFKIFQVSELADEHLANDGESTYSFVSEKIRPDYVDYLNFMMGKFNSFLGSPRTENYMHHFDYPESTAVLNEIAFQRGNPDAKDCNGAPAFFSTGSGGGYAGMSEEGYRNNQNPMCYVDDQGEEHRINSAPIRNYDASYESGGYDWEANILTIGSDFDIGQQAKPAYGGTRPGTFREEMSGGHFHEWTHTWEAFHYIVGAEMGTWKFDHSGAVMHGLSIPIELYIREYMIDDSDYDGSEKLWSLKKYDNRDITNEWFHQPDYLAEWRAGNQDVEQVWSAYLIKQFGLEKVYSEFYRLGPSSGDFRVALHQTFGSTYDQLLQDAAEWAATVNSHEDFRLLFDSADAFVANLNQSYNVSLLQARNASTPNQRYQTLYTYIGDTEPSGVGTDWMSVSYADSDSLALTEGTEVTVTRSESGQLQINGHDAYFYSGDTSVFHAGGIAASDSWSAFTRYGERTSDLWFPVFIYDHDEDGLPDDYDPDYQTIYFTDDGKYKGDVWPGDE
jgi:hypothetical protein